MNEKEGTRVDSLKFLDRCRSCVLLVARAWRLLVYTPGEETNPEEDKGFKDGKDETNGGRFGDHRTDILEPL